MKAYIKCGSGHAIGFGKAQSPRKSAGRSSSNAPAWVVTAPLSSGLNVSPEQQLMTGRASQGPIGNTTLPRLRDGEVTGGPPGGVIGGGGGAGGGGDSHGSGGGSSSGPGPQWWLFCIQAAAAGWAAGCVLFEAGHILHQPAPTAHSLPASTKMELARKSVVQMQHDRFPMSWLWILLAALGSIAVVLSKQREGLEADLQEAVEEGVEDDTCMPAPVTSEDSPLGTDSLGPELQELSTEAVAAASEPHADREFVPTIDPELYNASRSVFTASAAAAPADSAPLPSLKVLACHENVSFDELQRFWASGGTVSPRSPECGDGPTQPRAEVLHPLHKRPTSLESCQHPPAAAGQASAGPGCSTSKPSHDMHQLSSRSHHGSDAMSWPSTPHTPDLKGGGRSAELAAAGVYGPTAAALMKRAQGAASESTESLTGSDTDEPGQVELATTKVAEMNGFEEISHSLASDVSRALSVLHADVVDASDDEEGHTAEPQSMACTIDSEGLSSPVGSRVPTGGIKAGADEGCGPRCTAARDSHTLEQGMPHAAQAESGSSLASDSAQHSTAASSQLSSAPCSVFPGESASDSSADEAPDSRTCSAFSLPQSVDHVQVHTALNLRSFPYQASGHIPKPIIVSDEMSATVEATSPGPAPLTDRSCVKGGLDTTGSTVFPQHSWQIADDIVVDGGRNSTPQRPAGSCISDGDAESAGLLSPPQHSVQGSASDGSFGSSGSPSFMSFPSEQNQVSVFQWN